MKSLIIVFGSSYKSSAESRQVHCVVRTPTKPHKKFQRVPILTGEEMLLLLDYL